MARLAKDRPAARHIQANDTCAAIAGPGKVKSEIVKPYRVLRGGFGPNPKRAQQLRAVVMEKRATCRWTRKIDLVHSLPMAPAGQLFRKASRARVAAGMEGMT
ncbi:MAG: hypothetical protein ACLFQL_11690 [Paracoccaceae bacterium]